VSVMTAFEYSIKVKSSERLGSLLHELSGAGVPILCGVSGGKVTEVYRIGMHTVIINHSSASDNRIKNYFFDIGAYTEPRPTSKLFKWLKKHKAKSKYAYSLP